MRESDLAERLREVIGELVRATRDQAGTPSTAQSETLGLLDRQGPMNVAALAERRQVKHQSMRLVVGQLETMSLVDRLPDPADGRSQLVAINGEGRDALLSARAARSQWIEAALAVALSDEERDVLDAAIPLLRRVAAHRT